MPKEKNKAEVDFIQGENLSFETTGLLKVDLQGVYRVSLFNAPDIPGHFKHLGALGGYNILDIELPIKIPMKKFPKITRKGLYFSYGNWKEYTKFDYDRMENAEPFRKFHDEVKVVSLEPVVMVGRVMLKDAELLYFYMTKV